MSTANKIQCIDVQISQNALVFLNCLSSLHYYVQTCSFLLIA
jgi:hypothetical protein